jgi:hypothetical protein
MAEGSGRSLLLLGLSLILLTVVVGVVIFDRLVQPTSPTPEASLPGIQLTARQALAPAAELAGQWQEDARMAAVSAFWSRVGMQLGGQAEWAFQFFSPSTRRLAIITVADGRAQMMRESASPYTVATFSAEEWKVDSDQALQTWWNRGGGTLVSRRPEIDLAMQLRPLDENGQPVWSVVGSTAGTETAFTVVVSAADGTVVE